VFLVFVSYRHGDADHAAGRIRERLVNKFGVESIFLDVESIKPGRDFRSEIQHWIEQSSVLLVVIGNHWLDKEASGRPRLLQDDDWVRYEIELAIRLNIPVVPLLVGSRGMPEASSLPESIKPFAFREARRIRAAPVDFDHDILRLCRELVQLKEDLSRGPMLCGESNSPAIWITPQDTAHACVAMLMAILTRLGSDKLVENVSTIKQELQQAVAAAVKCWEGRFNSVSGSQSNSTAIPYAFRDICCQLKETCNRSSSSIDVGGFFNYEQTMKDLEWIKRQMLQAPEHDPSRYMAMARETHRRAHDLASGRSIEELAMGAIESYWQHPMASWIAFDDQPELRLPCGGSVCCPDPDVFFYLIATRLHGAIVRGESYVLEGPPNLHNIHRFLAAKFRDPFLADSNASACGLAQLRFWLRNLSLPSQVRNFAAYQLGISRYLPALDTLHWAAQHDRIHEVALYAAISLGRIGDERSIDVFNARLRWETNVELREAINNAKDYICGQVPFPYPQ